MTPSLNSFVRPAFATAVHQGTNPLALARHLARIPGLHEHLPLPDGERRWLKLPTDAGCDAWLIGWPPASRTGWHDHRGAAGAFVLLKGGLSEWSVPGAGGVSRVPGGEVVDVSYDEVRVRAFGADEGRAFADHHIHDMANVTDQPAYSLHAYAPELGAMASYDWIGGRLTWTGSATSEAW